MAAGISRLYLGTICLQNSPSAALSGTSRVGFAVRGYAAAATKRQPKATKPISVVKGATVKAAATNLVRTVAKDTASKSAAKSAASQLVSKDAATKSTSAAKPASKAAATNLVKTVAKDTATTSSANSAASKPSWKDAAAKSTPAAKPASATPATPKAKLTTATPSTKDGTTSKFSKLVATNASTSSTPRPAQKAAASQPRSAPSPTPSTKHHRTAQGGMSYKVAEKTDAPLTEEEQMAQLEQVMNMSKLFPTADPWGQRVETLDVMLPYSTLPSRRSDYPSLKAMYGQFKDNLRNTAKNYTSMLMLAQENAVPGIDLSGSRWWHKMFTQWPWRLASTTSLKETSWTTSIRMSALETYCKLNTALAQADDKAIKSLTSSSYQDEVMRLRRKQARNYVYRWHFHKQVTPARVLSIRANQGYLATDDPKFGNRMMIHALVRLDVEQSLEIYSPQGIPLHAIAEDPKSNFGSPAQGKRVTEYFVLEKRMWYDGPWIIREQLWEAPGKKAAL